MGALFALAGLNTLSCRFPWTSCLKLLYTMSSTSQEVESLNFAIRKIRESLELTQEEFGALIGVSGKTVSRWELGQSEPTFTVSQIKALLSVLERVGMAVADLPERYVKVS